MASGPRPTYQSYLKSFKSVLQAKTLPHLVAALGSSDALNSRTLAVLSGRLKKQNMTVTSIEAESLSAAKLGELVRQRSLFEPKSAYLVRRVDRAKQFPKLLGELETTDLSATHLLLSGEGFPVALEKEITRLGGVAIVSADPWPSEMPDVIFGLAQEKGLSLDRSAVALLLEAVGNDIGRLDNELGKLALIAGKESPVLKGSDIASHLGFLREDHAFRLDQYLLERDYARAEALCFDLLHRGEQAIQILWILTNHFRKAINAAHLVKKGASAKDISFKLRLPPMVAKSYQSYVGRGDTRRFASGLAACQLADVQLKTSAMDDFVILSSVISSAYQ